MIRLLLKNTLVSCIWQQARKTPSIVTLGITPTYPSTGYGYIQQGELTDTSTLPVYKVSRFTEKPDRTTAEEFLATGEYSWNSGMFIFLASVVISELKQYVPEIIEPLLTEGVSIYPQIRKEKYRLCFDGEDQISLYHTSAVSLG